jgi:hypothetical protein
LQFQVLETVPDIIQQVGVAVNQATDVDPIPPTPDVLSVNDMVPATSGLASSSTITPIEVPQTSDAIPTGTSGTGTSTGPDPTDSAVSASTSTHHHDPAATKALFQKRYQHKAKMVPGVGVTAR